MNCPPLDLVALTKRTLGNVVLRDDLLRLFREHGPLALGAAIAGYDARDADTIVAAAHRLKGSAATIAAIELADTARRIEVAAGAKDWPAVAQALIAAEGHIRLCLQQIASLLQP